MSARNDLAVIVAIALVRPSATAGAFCRFVMVQEADGLMNADRGNFRWKGLDPDRGAVFLGYDQAERMITALLERAADWQPDLVVGIARGGLIPATMAAAALALPLAAIAYDRDSGRTAWIGAAPIAQRVLLVDDGCSTGRTMRVVRDMIMAEMRACLTMSIVYDPERSAFKPDLSHPIAAFWRFPWERGETTPAGRARRIAGLGPDRRTELPYLGFGLNDFGASEMAAVAAHRGLLGLPTDQGISDVRRAIVISSRKEQDRAGIETSLAEHGYDDFPVAYCPDDLSDPAAVARYKADTATRIGCTHFIESDPQQAIPIAAFAPHLVVTWWSGEARQGYVLGAAEKA